MQPVPLVFDPLTTQCDCNLPRVAIVESDSRELVPVVTIEGYPQPGKSVLAGRRLGNHVWHVHFVAQYVAGVVKDYHVEWKTAAEAEARRWSIGGGPRPGVRRDPLCVVASTGGTLVKSAGVAWHLEDHPSRGLARLAATLSAGPWRVWLWAESWPELPSVTRYRALAILVKDPHPARLESLKICGFGQNVKILVPQRYQRRGIAPAGPGQVALFQAVAAPAEAPSDENLGQCHWLEQGFTRPPQQWAERVLKMGLTQRPSVEDLCAASPGGIAIPCEFWGIEPARSANWGLVTARSDQLFAANQECIDTSAVARPQSDRDLPDSLAQIELDLARALNFLDMQVRRPRRRLLLGSAPDSAVLGPREGSHLHHYGALAQLWSWRQYDQRFELAEHVADYAYSFGIDWLTGACRHSKEIVPWAETPPGRGAGALNHWSNWRGFAHAWLYGAEPLALAAFELIEQESLAAEPPLGTGAELREPVEALAQLRTAAEVSAYPPRVARHVERADKCIAHIIRQPGSDAEDRPFWNPAAYLWDALAVPYLTSTSNLVRVWLDERTAPQLGRVVCALNASGEDLADLAGPLADLRAATKINPRTGQPAEVRLVDLAYLPEVWPHFVAACRRAGLAELPAVPECGHVPTSVGANFCYLLVPAAGARWDLQFTEYGAEDSIGGGLFGPAGEKIEFWPGGKARSSTACEPLTRASGRSARRLPILEIPAGHAGLWKAEIVCGGKMALFADPCLPAADLRAVGGGDIPTCWKVQGEVIWGATHVHAADFTVSGFNWPPAVTVDEYREPRLFSPRAGEAAQFAGRV